MPNISLPPQPTSGKWMALVPLCGVALFIMLYIVATLFYPGGSQANQHSNGFDWANNYWCNLLNEKAINGQLNPARPIAMFAMGILCGTLAWFWYVLPVQTGLPKTQGRIIQVFGVAAMGTGMFLFTRFHDLVINVAGLFGVIALTGTFVGLHKLGWKRLFWAGLFNVVLVVLNNILYYNPGLIRYLPVVQKVTFLYFLLWIFLINLQFLKKRYESM